MCVLTIVVKDWLGEGTERLRESWSRALPPTCLPSRMEAHSARAVYNKFACVNYGSIQKLSRSLPTSTVPEHVSVSESLSLRNCNPLTYMGVVQYSFISNWGLAPCWRGACARTVWLTMVFAQAYHTIKLTNTMSVSEPLRQPCAVLARSLRAQGF